MCSWRALLLALVMAATVASLAVENAEAHYNQQTYLKATHSNVPKTLSAATDDYYDSKLNELVSTKKNSNRDKIKHPIVKTLSNSEYNSLMKKYNYGKMNKQGITYNYKPKSYFDLPRNYIKFDEIIDSKDENGVLPDMTFDSEITELTPLLEERPGLDFIVHLIEPNLYLKVPASAVGSGASSIRLSDISVLNPVDVPDTGVLSLSVQDPVWSQIRLLGRMEAGRRNYPALSASTEIKLNVDQWDLERSVTDGEKVDESHNFSSQSTTSIDKNNSTSELVQEMNHSDSVNTTNLFNIKNSSPNLVNRRPRRALAFFKFGGNSNPYDGQSGGPLPPPSDYSPVYGIRNSTIDPERKRIRMNQLLSNMDDSHGSNVPSMLIPQALGSLPSILNFSLPTLPPLIAPAEFAKLFTIPPIEDWFTINPNSTPSPIQWILPNLTFPTLPGIPSLPISNNLFNFGHKKENVSNTAGSLFTDIQNKISDLQYNVSPTPQFTKSDSLLSLLKNSSFINPNIMSSLMEKFKADLKTDSANKDRDSFTSSIIRNDITTQNPFENFLKTSNMSGFLGNNLLTSSNLDYFSFLPSIFNMSSGASNLFGKNKFISSSSKNTATSSTSSDIFKDSNLFPTTSTESTFVGFLPRVSPVNFNPFLNVMRTENANNENIKGNETNDTDKFYDFFRRLGMPMIKSGDDEREENISRNIIPGLFQTYLPPNVNDLVSNLTPTKYINEIILNGSKKNVSGALSSLDSWIKNSHNTEDLLKTMQSVNLDQIVSPTSTDEQNTIKTFNEHLEPEIGERSKANKTEVDTVILPPLNFIVPTPIVNINTNNRRDDSVGFRVYNSELNNNDNEGQHGIDTSVKRVTIEEAHPFLILSADDRESAGAARPDAVFNLNNILDTVQTNPTPIEQMKNIFGKSSHEDQLEKIQELPFPRLPLNLPSGLIENFMASSNLPSGLLQNVLRSMRSAELRNDPQQYNTLFPTVAPFTFPTIAAVEKNPPPTIAPIFRFDTTKSSFSGFPTLPPLTFPTTTPRTSLPTLFPPITASSTPDNFTLFLQDQAKKMSEFFEQMSDFSVNAIAGLRDAGMIVDSIGSAASRTIHALVDIAQVLEPINNLIIRKINMNDENKNNSRGSSARTYTRTVYS